MARGSRTRVSQPDHPPVHLAVEPGDEGLQGVFR